MLFFFSIDASLSSEPWGTDSVDVVFVMALKMISKTPSKSTTPKKILHFSTFTKYMELSHATSSRFQNNFKPGENAEGHWVKRKIFNTFSCMSTREIF